MEAMIESNAGTLSLKPNNFILWQGIEFFTGLFIWIGDSFFFDLLMIHWRYFRFQIEKVLDLLLFIQKLAWLNEFKDWQVTSSFIANNTGQWSLG